MTIFVSTTVESSQEVLGKLNDIKLPFAIVPVEIHNGKMTVRIEYTPEDALTALFVITLFHAAEELYRKQLITSIFELITIEKL